MQAVWNYPTPSVVLQMLRLVLTAHSRAPSESFRHAANLLS
jgi:hypothetical protein